MEVLKHFVCDHCGEIIDSPEHGWLEWLRNEQSKSHNFRIVHHMTVSPLSGDHGKGCYSNTPKMTASLHLKTVVGSGGLAYLLSLLNSGPDLGSDDNFYKVARLHEWMELVRRTQIPFYEEARIYWARARQDGFFDGGNEVWIYHPDTLKRLVERYRA